MSFLKTILSTVKTAAHAVAPSQITGMTTRHLAEGLQLLVTKGWLKAGTRSCAGKYFTNPAKRDAIALVFSTTTPAKGKVFNFIVSQPHSVDANTIKAALRFHKTPDASLRALVALGALKQHTKKAGHYYSNPDHKDFFKQLFFGEVGKYDTLGKAAYVAAVRADEVISRSTPAPATTDACPACGRADAQPDAPAIEEQDIKTQVLALLRLSKHGVTIWNIQDALIQLEESGIIRTDERDADMDDEEGMRYFVRKSKRPEADEKIARLIANNAALMAKIDAIVPAS